LYFNWHEFCVEWNKNGKELFLQLIELGKLIKDCGGKSQIYAAKPRNDRFNQIICWIEEINKKLNSKNIVTIPTTNQEPLKKDSPQLEEPKKKNNFLRSTYDELKLVVWPNKQQLFSESVAVIIMVSFSAAAIASVSRFYGWAASQIFG